MAEPIKLHPKIRERKTSRIGATSLAEYIISAPDQQDTALHNERYSSSFASPKYAEAKGLIASFSCQNSKDWPMLENGRLSLLNKAQDPAFKPSQQEEALRCAETIELFTKSANIFNSGGFSASIPDTFTKVSIEGTEVSIQPDLLIGSKFPPDSDKKAGLVFFRPQKRPDPSTAKQDETRLARENYRRETAKYILALGYILFENQGLTPSQIDKKKMRVWDFRLGEAIDFPSDFLTRRKRIISACRQIANLWGSIPPRPSDLL